MLGCTVGVGDTWYGNKHMIGLGHKSSEDGIDGLNIQLFSGMATKENAYFFFAYSGESMQEV